MPTLLQAVAASTGALGLAGGAWWYASAWPGSQLFGSVLVAGKDAREIALTFDDGPNDAATPRLLDVLASHNIRATFFCIGSYVRKQPQIVREIVAQGHILGNHTMHHPRLSLQPAARIRQELAGCNAAIEDITGAPVRYFRPPFGARRPVVLRAARELGLIPVQWNIAGYDWRSIGVDGILDHLERGISRNRRRQRGSNILLHDGGHLGMSAMRSDTVRAVDCFLTAHTQVGTRFVTVDAWDTRTPPAVPDRAF